MLHHCSGQPLDYVGTRSASLIECLDNSLCRVCDIADFGVHCGATMVLLMAAICIGYRLQDIIGLPSSLSDEGLDDLLEGYDDVANRVMLGGACSRHCSCCVLIMGYYASALSPYINYIYIYKTSAL